MFDLSFNGKILKISPINGVLDGKLSEFCIGTSSIELGFSNECLTPEVFTKGGFGVEEKMPTAPTGDMFITYQTL
jgi:hypothetical protein